MVITKQELQSSLAQAEALQGQYLVFAESTQEQPVKQMFQQMASDASQHIQRLQTKLEQMRYSQWVTAVEPQPARTRNALYAFFVGGLVCLLGQGLTDLWEWALGVSHKQAGDPTVATLVLLGALLTGLGWFDKLARYAGAGLAVPVTGFANAMTAAALEFKREGLVFGVGGRMFQLAGAVIVFGVATAFVVGLVAAVVGR